MKFRTEIRIPQHPRPINYQEPVLMLGSCFTDYIGSILEKYLFDVTVNPFGVIYNPLSIRNSINALLNKDMYEQADLQKHNDLWFSFDHYTRFSDPDPGAALEKINSAFLRAKQKLTSASHLVLTFGTAFIYELPEKGRVVNNCHKIPASQFRRRMLSTNEIVEEVTVMMQELLAQVPNLQIILTVSPVRHVKDGLAENQRSKAALVLAAAELTKGFPENCTYFPSYEIMMDDLRDYRFYGADLVHPNEQAIGYIWEKFLETCFSEQAREIIREIEPVIRARGHRPLHTQTPAYQKFQSELDEKVRKLKNKFSFLQWEMLP